MDTRHLEEIVKVAELGSVSKAAQCFFISQSALSKHIASVENELGIILFDRSGGKLELTEPGRVFVKGAQHILDLGGRYLENARAAGREGRGFVVAGNLRRDSVFPRVARAVGQLSGRYPGIRVDLQDIGVRDYVESLRSGEVDVAVSFLTSELSNTELSFRPLCKVPFSANVHVGHSLSGRGGGLFEDLASFDIYVYEKKGRRMYHSLLNSAFSRHGLPSASLTQPSFSFGFPDPDRGVLVTPYFSSYERYYSECRTFLLDWPNESFILGLAWDEKRLSSHAAGAQLLRLLERELKDCDFVDV